MLNRKLRRSEHFESVVTREGVSLPALAFATRVTESDFRDVYRMARLVDEAFHAAIERTRKEERERIFRMGFMDLMREFWRGRKVKHVDVIEERANRPNPL
jgi:hypothetical protein